jgi:hypothetical protein
MTPPAAVETQFPFARWAPSLPALRERYAQAEPFPHIHLEEFLDAAVIERAIAEFPSIGSDGWVHYKHFNENKQGMTARDAFPPVIGAVVDELNSPAFVAWLSELTSIPNLVADPGLEGGGMHQSGAGGFLNVHADFTRHHHQTTWRRRVNVIVYLNDGWQPEWGGAIELWDREMRRPVVRVPPLANHAVIFNTDETSYHGFADPLRCPPGVTRKSLATYYYTVEAQTDAPARSTNYQARPGDGVGKTALIWADKTLVSLYSRAKTTFGLSDDAASRALRLLDRWKRKP